MPPQRPKETGKRIDSTFFGPCRSRLRTAGRQELANMSEACPQFVSGGSSLWNMYQPPNPVVNIGEPSNAGAVAWGSAEDCLSIAVWTPSYANETSKLPVAFFVTGGGGVTGGVNIPSQLPSDWVSRTQEHIVVTMNYRANLFGSIDFNPLADRFELADHLLRPEIKSLERDITNPARRSCCFGVGLREY